MSKFLLHRERSSQLFPIFLGLGLEQRDIYAVLELSNSFVAEEDAAGDEGAQGVVLCMMEIPDLMIPCDILAFFAQGLAEIDCFRIFRHYLHVEKYVGLLFFSDARRANLFLQHFNQQLLSTLFEGVCDLRPVTAISIQTNVHHVPLSDYSVLQRNFHDMELQVATEAELAARLHDATSPSRRRGSGYHGSSDKDDACAASPCKSDLCTLCLEPLAPRRPQSVVLYCGHVFHLQCLVRAEGLFCPVCRFQHAHSVHDAPACATCQQLCHAAAPDADGSATAADDCVALAPWKSPLPATALAAASSLDVARDVWLCLVCGATTCGDLQRNHRRAHFEDTRHAYAMNVFSRRVYDFAGGGYVHRLMLQQTDDSDDRFASPPPLAAAASVAPQTPQQTPQSTTPLKIVEHHPPMFQLETHLPGPSTSLHGDGGSVWTRPLHPPPLSLAHEAQREAYKLEDLVQQYNEVLAWRMQQTREHYEAQLRRIWQHARDDDDAAEGDGGATAAKTRATAAAGTAAAHDGLFWLRKLLKSLQQEKQKCLAQNETLRHKLRMSQREQEDARSMCEQLRANEAVWQEQVKAREAACRRAQQSQQVERDEWQGKVAALMRRLEDATRFDSSTRPSDRVCGTAPGADDGGDGDAAADGAS
eukprot:gene964-692_t